MLFGRAMVGGVGLSVVIVVDDDVVLFGDVWASGLVLVLLVMVMVVAVVGFRNGRTLRLREVVVVVDKRGRRARGACWSG